MIQNRIDVFSIIYLGCTMLYGPLKDITITLNHYVPVFATYNYSW